ncbi:hypothetical protein BLOT_000012 [Blomia tropicalis]|nr:hypothetical protein BLOT_000012 [Blomia tropicalis]
MQVAGIKFDLKPMHRTNPTNKKNEFKIGAFIIEIKKKEAKSFLKNKYSINQKYGFESCCTKLQLIIIDTLRYSLANANSKYEGLLMQTFSIQNLILIAIDYDLTHSSRESG